MNKLGLVTCGRLLAREKFIDSHPCIERLSGAPDGMSLKGKGGIPSRLPVLAVENRVLLPGSSLVVQVSDPRG